MAEWSYGVNDAATVKLYSHKLFTQAITRTTCWKMAQVGMRPESEDNIVQLLDDTQKSAGDTIKYNLLPKLVGPGVIGDNVMSGSAEALATFQDQLIINQLRHAVQPHGAMSQQRVPFNLRNAARQRLADWWATRLDVSLLNQLCGNTYQSDVRFTGLQSPIAPDASHAIFANGRANEGALVANDIFTLDLIDQAVAQAHTLETPIRSVRIPVRDGGAMEVFGVLFIHPFQTKSLRTNFTQGQWGAIQSDAIKGGQITGNPIFTGALGMYANTVIHEAPNIPYGSLVDDPTGNRFNLLGQEKVARAVFCGPQAACMGLGRAYDTTMKAKWFEELSDGANILTIYGGMIFGMKKTRFDSKDFATITISSYEDPTLPPP